MLWLLLAQRGRRSVPCTAPGTYPGCHLQPQNVPSRAVCSAGPVAAGIYPPLVAEQKLVLAKDVRQALMYADRGEVDVAFVYRTDALLASQAKILFTVPQKRYPQISYPAALTKSGAQHKVPAPFIPIFSATQPSRFFASTDF